MDSLITAAARALAAGDPLGALKRVSLRDDAPALALRGIAMAQLGDFVRAKTLLQKSRPRLRSARGGGPRAVRRCRGRDCARVSRDLGFPAKALDAARATLEQHGDRLNAAHARYLEIRRLLLIGRLDEAERKLAELDPAPFPPASQRRARTGRRGDRHATRPGEELRTRHSPAPSARARGRHSRADGGDRKRICRSSTRLRRA